MKKKKSACRQSKPFPYLMIHDFYTKQSNRIGFDGSQNWAQTGARGRVETGETREEEGDDHHIVRLLLDYYGYSIVAKDRKL